MRCPAEGLAGFPLLKKVGCLAEFGGSPKHPS
jgi:hypothetical protein